MIEDKQDKSKAPRAGWGIPPKVDCDCKSVKRHTVRKRERESTREKKILSIDTRKKEKKNGEEEEGKGNSCAVSPFPPEMLCLKVCQVNEFRQLKSCWMNKYLNKARGINQLDVIDWLIKTSNFPHS